MNEERCQDCDGRGFTTNGTYETTCYSCHGRGWVAVGTQAKREYKPIVLAIWGKPSQEQHDRE